MDDAYFEGLQDEPDNDETPFQINKKLNIPHEVAESYQGYRENLMNHFNLSEKGVDEYIRTIEPHVIFQAGYNARIKQEQKFLRFLGWIV